MSPPIRRNGGPSQETAAAANTSHHHIADNANHSYVLREYQSHGIRAIEKSWAGGVQRTAIVLPTGAGKTVVFSHVIANAGVKALVLAHREELIEQAAAKIAAIAPHLKVGVVKAERDEHAGYDVAVASVQTVARAARRERITGIELVVVDEAHHAVAETYRDVLRHFGCFEPGGARALGVTATMARADSMALADVWQEIAYRLDILDLVEEGHLADVRGIRVHAAGLDLGKVKSTAGDFNTGSLTTAMDLAGAWDAAADAYLEHASDRQGIAFTPTVESAHMLAGLLSERGISAEALNGTTPSDERAAILSRFEAGATQVVSNCGVLTEGYDAPWCSAVLLARPTKSEVLFVQMAGRGLRTHPGKTDALVIDVVGTTTGKKLATLACLTGRDIGEIPEGVSLAEAHERHLVESTTASPYLGQLTADEIDLFVGSQIIWPEWNGVRYIDLSNRRETVYVAPSPDGPGLYDVIVRDRVRRSEDIATSNVGLTAALRRAERYAAGHGQHLVSREASWRTSKPATHRQYAVLRRLLGRPVRGRLTAGQASDMISSATIGKDFTYRPPRGYTAERIAA